MKPKKPLLSIGIIFKNEIRCLERCLKSFEKLRKAVPCEVVMADTGSTDGSREVAEKYADILFDFPWINDFSAARNAVMDRSSGKLFFVVDADEWLDEDITELVSFVKSGGRSMEKVCCVVIRNYMSRDSTENCSDFYGTRICRMSSGLRYEGAIHEHWPDAGSLRVMRRTILHHDGYAFQDSEEGKQKHKRNMDLLRRELDESPDSLRVLLQCLESGQEEEDYWDLVKRAVAAVEEHKSYWEIYGPPIFRQAVRVAKWKDAPEFDTWAERAEELFPESYFIRIDIQYLMFTKCWDREKYDDCVRRGEEYLRALEDSRAGRGDLAGKVFSALNMEAPTFERSARILLGGAYLRSNHANAARAMELLGGLEVRRMDEDQLKNYALLLQELHGGTDLDTSELSVRTWEEVFEPGEEREDAEKYKNTWLAIAAQAFRPADWEKERQKENFHRYAYTLYLPLRERCDLGRSAAVLESYDPAEMAELLEQVEDWSGIPDCALSHALELGAAFPPPGRPVNIEDLDSLATRLSRDKEHFIELALNCAERTDMEDLASLTWARGLLLSAVSTYAWAGEEQDEEQGMALARTFAKIEDKFLPFCYSAEALQEERLFVLPPLHRFGLYCTRAFQALEQGNATEYVQLLRAGLDSCKRMKDMVKFLADHTAEIQQMMAPPDLKALADQVRVILARFDPDDPAVAALKQSEAYRKVAYLIEGMAVPVWGGQPQ